jgi:hypothetical protein
VQPQQTASAAIILRIAQRARSIDVRRIILERISLESSRYGPALPVSEAGKE